MVSARKQRDVHGFSHVTSWYHGIQHVTLGVLNCVTYSMVLFFTCKQLDIMSFSTWTTWHHGIPYVNSVISWVSKCDFRCVDLCWWWCFFYMWTTWYYGFLHVNILISWYSICEQRDIMSFYVWITWYHGFFTCEHFNIIVSNTWTIWHLGILHVNSAISWVSKCVHIDIMVFEIWTS